MLKLIAGLVGGDCTPRYFLLLLLLPLPEVLPDCGLAATVYIQGTSFRPTTTEVCQPESLCSV